MNLTLPQQDIYFEQLLYPLEPIYNIGAKVAIQGSVDYYIFNKAHSSLIEQHDSFRSILKKKDQYEVEIQILEDYNTSLRYEDFSNEENADKQANDFINNRFKQPFDFSEESFLFEFILIKVSDDFYYLFLVCHHIITDGWGTSLMFQRFVKNYNEINKSGEVASNYSFSYKDFIADDEKYFYSEDYNEDKEFWLEKFSNLPESIFDKIDVKKNVNKSKRKELIVPRKTYNKLDKLAKEWRCSTFHVILGLLYLYFGRKHENKDIAIGLPVLNRSKSIFKKTVGLFMGVSALRMQLNFEDTFENLVLNIKKELRQNYRYQRFPLGKLIQALDFKDSSTRKLFNISLSYEKQDYADHFENTKSNVIALTHEAERVALAVYIREFDAIEDVKIDFDYNINYFDDASISQVVQHFEKLIEEIAIDPKQKLSNYNYLSERERDQLLIDFNETAANYNENETLLNHFQRQVSNNPLHIAVANSNSDYSYKELDLLSDIVSNKILARLDDDMKKPIAVMMQRNAELIIILLGILKSGNSFIPLDPDFPDKRLVYILEHSEVSLLVVDKLYENKTSQSLDILSSTEAMRKSHVWTKKIVRTVKPNDTAYIIYTSGSTGKPKGVEISHESFLNFLLSIQKEPGFNKKDILFSATTQSFDISLLEFFNPIISGATSHIAANNILQDPKAIIRSIEKIRPTIIQATPSFYQMLFNAGWKCNSEIKILCGGDLLSESLAEKLINSSKKVWNMYGPTEATIWSSIKKVAQAKQSSNIGKPIDNVKHYVLDEFLNLQPIGTAGTIYISGKGLAKGYYKNVKLTEEKFISNPFEAQSTIYNTGDLGKWNEDGEILFLGRKDNQVKVRGYRIELGEIETKLAKISTIKSAVVVAKNNKEQEAMLIAYIIPKAKSIKLEDIISNLRRELPEYMIPYTIIPLDEFPQTNNNKIDRKSLENRALNSNAIKSQYKKPGTSLEAKLASLYQEVLEIDKNIGVLDNFFSLGGHSLNAVKLIGKIEQQLNYRISLKTIFDYPTIASLSAYLNKKEKKTPELKIPIIVQDQYPVTLSQYSIWLAGLKGEKSVAYNMFRSFSVIGDLNKETMELAFIQIIEKYESLRTTFMIHNGYPHQKINKSGIQKFKIDIINTTRNELDNDTENYVNYEFDLENETLLRVGLFKVNDGFNVLTFVTHHIIMDGWSLEILIKEVVNNYKSIYELKTNNYDKKKLSFQFKDYTMWQKIIVEQNEIVNHKFWTNYLKDYSWKELIPSDFKKVSKELGGSFYNFNWDNKFLKKLNSVALDNNITLHSLLVSGFYGILTQVYNNTDICIGTINSGRSFSELHSQIGMFVKTLPMRIKVNPDHPIDELFHKIQDNSLNIDAHQDVPEDILSQLRLDAIIVLQNPTFNYKKIKINDEISLEAYEVNVRYNRLPILLNFTVNDNNLQGTIHYDTSKYEKATIEFLVLKYKKLLDEIIVNPKQSLATMDLSLSFEKEKTIDIEFSF